jgi:hypothetical protein
MRRMVGSRLADYFAPLWLCERIFQRTADNFRSRPDLAWHWEPLSKPPAQNLKLLCVFADDLFCHFAHNQQSVGRVRACLRVQLFQNGAYQ